MLIVSLECAYGVSNLHLFIYFFFMQYLFHCYETAKLDWSIIKVAIVTFQEVNNVIEEASQQAIQNLPRYVRKALYLQ